MLGAEFLLKTTRCFRLRAILLISQKFFLTLKHKIFKHLRKNLRILGKDRYRILKRSKFLI